MSANATNVSSLAVNVIERNCVFAINVFLSILGAIVNVIVVILIYKNQSLRKNCKYLQAALAAGDVVSCLGQVSNMTTSLIVPNLELRMIRWHCLVLSTHGHVGVIYSVFMTVFIACDRFIAITFPVKYRIMPKLKLCSYCVGVSLTISLVFTIATFTDVDLFSCLTALCVGPGSRSPKMTDVYNNLIAFAGICVIIIYPITLGIIFFKTKQIGSTSSIDRNSSTNQTFLKQVEITASITCVIVASLFMYVIPNLLLTILKWLDSKQPIIMLIISRAPSYIASGLTIHSGVNVLFYIWKDKPMRDAFKKLVRSVRA